MVRDPKTTHHSAGDGEEEEGEEEVEATVRTVWDDEDIQRAHSSGATLAMLALPSSLPLCFALHAPAHLLAALWLNWLAICEDVPALHEASCV